MFRVLSVLACVLWTMPAGATDDIEAMKNQYYDLRGGCRQGEIAGKAITPAESGQACAAMGPLYDKIIATGLCWDAGEVIFDKCPLVN